MKKNVKGFYKVTVT